MEALFQISVSMFHYYKGHGKLKRKIISYHKYPAIFSIAADPRPIG